MVEVAVLEQARQTLQLEAEALQALVERVGPAFEDAFTLLRDMGGRAVTCGIGKSGAVARKLAGTLASTGTTAFFLHPAEATHGDLGMVTQDDVVIFLSNSGETQEILALLPAVRRIGAGLVAICGVATSSLARDADAVLDVSVEHEACPLRLAPTTSCIAQMAMGDALAMALMRARGFTQDDYARNHPGGTLGRRTLWRVRDVMHRGEDLPALGLDATVMDALLAMSRTGVRGAVLIVDEGQTLRGLFTDGDLRMVMQRERDRNVLMDQPVTRVMSLQPTTVAPEVLAAEALNLMQEREFDNLPVVDEQGRAVGLLDIQDLLKAGII